MTKHLDLDALQAAAEAATQDEWTPMVPMDGSYKHGIRAKAGLICSMPEWRMYNPVEQMANAAHIVAFQPAVVLALIDRLRKAEAASKWISVDERLPEEEGWYAVMVGDPDDIGWETRCWWRALWKSAEQEWSSAEPVEDGQPVTHWKYIAAPDSAPTDSAEKTKGGAA